MNTQGLYQTHSETSRIGAEMRDMSLIETIHMMIGDEGQKGLTGRGIAQTLKIAPGTASARLSELRDRGVIKKSREVRYHKIGGKLVPSAVWKLSKYVDKEGEMKRDKLVEIRQIINEHISSNCISLETHALIKQITTVLN